MFCFLQVLSSFFPLLHVQLPCAGKKIMKLNFTNLILIRCLNTIWTSLTCVKAKLFFLSLKKNPVINLKTAGKSFPGMLRKYTD